MEFPALNEIARNMFCVMATNAASERVFSMAGHALNSGRANLRSSSVNDIILFNSPLKAKNEAIKVDQQVSRFQFCIYKRFSWL